MCVSPDLSVVIACVSNIGRLRSCLESVTRQCQARSVEVIVSSCYESSSLRDIVEEFSEVRFIFSRGKCTLPELWGIGIEESEGSIIAITESSCLFSDNWIEAIMKAHESEHAVIGGAVEPRVLTNWLDWAAYFCEYGQFMQPMNEGVVHELPGNNITFKRWVLDVGREYVRNCFWKTYWCRKLQENGIELRADPSILLWYSKSYELIPFLLRRFRHGRCFAGMRNDQISLLRRAVYAVGAPVLPFIFLKRTVSMILSKKRFLRQFILSSPICILTIVMWAVGEFCGYVSGKGNSCSHVY